MSDKEGKPPPTPTKVLVRELKKEPANLGVADISKTVGRVTWEQPTALQTNQYPFWYRFRAAFGSLIIVNVAICTYVLFTVKPKPKAPRKAPKGQIANSTDNVVAGPREETRIN